MTAGASRRTEGTVQRRRFGLYTLQLAIALIVMGGALLFLESRRLTDNVFEEAERQGMFLFTTMGQQVSDSLYFNDIEELRKDAEILTAQNSIRRIAVFNEEGRYLFDSTQVKVPQGFIAQELLTLSRDYSGPLDRWQDDYLEFVGAIRFDGRFMGGLYFQLDVSTQLAEVRADLIRLMIFGGLLVALASGLSFAIAMTVGATRSLKTVESNFRELIEQSPLPTAIYDAKGTLTYSNQAFRQLMDQNEFTRQALEPDYNILRDEVLGERQLMPLFRQGFDAGPVEVPQFEYSALDQPESLWLTAVVFPLRQDDGSKTEVVVVYQDVTSAKLAEDERARLGERILQSQKLEGLGVMARGIAHDFNNLLTPILGNAELLARKLGDNPEFLYQLRSIMSAAQHAADLCAQMLAYGGGGLQSKALIDVSAEVRALKELMASSVSKRTRFTQDLDEDLPPVLVDLSQLRQIILNLLVNASEALADNQGEIFLRTGIEEVSREKAHRLLPNPDIAPGRYVYLQVEDNGCGMTAEVQQNIFNPFFTTKFTGRGLGLSAVLGIVGDHDGGIEVSSEIGRGTVFTVYFPARSAGSDKPVASEPGNRTRFSGTVLLADDEQAVLDLGKHTLELLGFDVLTAENGQQALELFRQFEHQLSCILLDIIMPVLDGEAALARIRALNPDIPIILLTGMISEEATERLVDQPGVTILRKPYRIEDLEKTLAGILVDPI